MIGSLVAQASADSGTSDLRVALIGLLGAIVGGFITGLVTLIAEWRRQVFARTVEERRAKRLDEEEQAIARGTARVMRSEFRRLDRLWKNASSTKRWIRPLELLDLREPERADRKLLAARLDPSQWEAIEEAELLNGVMANLARRECWGESEVVFVAIKDRHQKYVLAMPKALGKAIAALDDVAEVSGAEPEDLQSDIADDDATAPGPV